MTLYLWFSDKGKFKITANSNFCNSGPFQIFCDDFENNLNHYALNANPALIRKPGAFEQKSFYLVLLGMTVFLGLAIIYSLSVGKGLSTFLVPIGLVTMLWVAYLNASKKRKERELNQN